MQYLPPLGIQNFHYFINWLLALIQKGKRSWLQASLAGVYVLTKIFGTSVADDPMSTISGLFKNIEQLIMIVIMYNDKTSQLSSVNDTRKELFCHNNWSIDRILPTHNPLFSNSMGSLPSWDLDDRHSVFSWPLKRVCLDKDFIYITAVNLDDFFGSI